MRYIAMTLIVFLISGCASKLSENESEKTLDYGMANSKKIEIKNSETSKTFVLITYLNPIQHELITQESEKFVVGTYKATGDGAFDKAILSKFKVNGSDANLSITPLSQDAPILKLISTSNAWTNYVLVQAPKTDEIKMEISFENDQSQRVSTTFRKDF
ncbi:MULTISPECIES: hypothetical protein [unclassified Sulfurospirillum]|uniref:hypothetical protein n=1 Tax=unclassified Sulfurospirillum TaxID=2618290 RepID=UPI000500D497|nr:MULTISPECIES: hypothetical protein [unclassified Sulfurospirillum]KFL34887.1 hypothetical protein JU57_02645 [Sulfurospirillum sp. SCADC]